MRTRNKTFRPYLAAVLLASLVLRPSEARAEQGPHVAGPIAVGSKVRLLAPTTIQGPIQGTVMEMDQESLLISTKDNRPLRVAWQTITQAEVSTGRRGHALKGMLIGVPLGVAYGAIVPLDTLCTPSELEVDDPSCASSRGALIALFTASFAGVGALIGHFVKSDRWSSVPVERLHVSIAPTPGRGARLSLTVGW